MSGLSHTPGKRAWGKTHRGFESRLLRQLVRATAVQWPSLLGSPAPCGLRRGDAFLCIALFPVTCVLRTHFPPFSQCPKNPVPCHLVTACSGRTKKRCCSTSPDGPNTGIGQLSIFSSLFCSAQSSGSGTMRISFSGLAACSARSGFHKNSPYKTCMGTGRRGDDQRNRDWSGVDQLGTRTCSCKSNPLCYSVFTV